MAADRAKPIECSAQPMGLSFHPARRIVAAGLVDGTVELHNFSGWPEKSARSTASTEEDDTIFASLPVHTKDKPKSSPTAAIDGADVTGKGPTRENAIWITDNCLRRGTECITALRDQFRPRSALARAAIDQ